MGTTVSDTVVEALIVDLLLWLEARERTYDEAIGAWRTSCPRLTVWEDANERGLIAIEEKNERRMVRTSAAGRTLLSNRKKR